MKKTILTLAIALSTLVAFAGEGGVNQKVLNAFNNEFKTARDVEWTVGDNYFRATFTYNDKHIFAYYSTNGDLLGLTRYLNPVDLPFSLQSELKKNYQNYWISDLFEVANDEGTSYYITLENAENKTILKASDVKNWNYYQKIKKT